MADPIGPPPVLSAPLSGVVTRQTADYLGEANMFRRYGGSMSTTTRTHNSGDVSYKRIGFSIGARAYASPLRGLVGEGQAQIDQRFELNTMVKTEISGLLRKYSNFGTDIETADLAGIVFMLAAAVAKYSVTGTLTCGEIRSGRPISVTSLAVRDRVTTSRDVVFIPRHAALVDVPGLFEALTAAANACGARVVTDVLAIDPVNNAPRLLEPAGAELAHACWTGIRGMLHMYDSSKAGAIAALAVTKGLHSVLTVVGHTDEGAIIRSVLRKDRYAVPYGGIYLSGMDVYVGLPTYRRVSNSSQQSAVDGICLATAAAVAVCDPTVEIEGRVYPTVISSTRGAVEEGGAHNEGTEEDARDITSILAGSSSTFSLLFVEELARLFMVTGGSETAARGMTHMFGSIAGTVDRHAMHKAVAPYYWIEPTSLYQFRPDSPATRAGFGPICGTDLPHELPFAEKVQAHSLHSNRQLYDSQWRSMRTTGLAVHMLGHNRGGAANVRFRQANPEMFAFKGAGVAETTRAAMLGGEDLGSFMWGHLSCMIPAPSECMYVGRYVRFAVQSALDGDNFETIQTHAFTPSDVLGVSAKGIVCHATRPSAVAPGGMIDDGRHVRRSRSEAKYALDSARHAYMRGPAADPVFGQVSFTEPNVPDTGDLIDAPEARALAPEEAGEAVIGPFAARGPAEAFVALRRAVAVRRNIGPVGDGGGAAVHEAARPLEEGIGVGEPPAPPAAAVADVAGEPGGVNE